ncbi:hypothetical protein GRFL_0564 [Christiangramia flava JLT2011]|uniref:Uncharacterized protein n=1 Tax=Christiangramia flava JLT2011 TaxID=1229726 RepID=A0A1L7I107_9FLAO|nr:hypothetical protein GRFL_0564 [Christiangramia flava JLT2011]
MNLIYWPYILFGDWSLLEAYYKRKGIESPIDIPVGIWAV